MQAKCTFLGQSDPKGSGDYIREPAFWYTETKQLHQALVQYSWKVRSHMEATVTLMWFNAVDPQRSIPFPRGLDRAMRCPDWHSLIPGAVGLARKAVANTCGPPHSCMALEPGPVAAEPSLAKQDLTCYVLGLPKRQTLMRYTADAQLGMGHLIQASDGTVKEYVLLANVIHEEWLCCARPEAWKIAKDGCAVFSFFELLSLASAAVQPTISEVGGARRNVVCCRSLESRADSTLEELAREKPEDTATLFALAAWRAEQIRVSRYYHGGPYSSALQLSRCGYGFEQNALTWDVFGDPNRNRVWFAWGMKDSRNHRDIDYTWACDGFCLKCRSFKEIVGNLGIPRPSSIGDFTPAVIKSVREESADECQRLAQAQKASVRRFAQSLKPEHNHSDSSDESSEPAACETHAVNLEGNRYNQALVVNNYKSQAATEAEREEANKEYECKLKNEKKKLLTQPAYWDHPGLAYLDAENN